MNSLGINLIVRLMLLAVVASAAILFPIDRTEGQTTTAEKRSTLTWEWNDDGWRRRVEVNGKAEFTDDYSDISGLTGGSYVRIEEDQHGQSRRLDIKRDVNGQLTRRYLVNGESRALDEAGRKWLAGLLLTAVRQGPLDVENRTRTILRKQGINGMLAEIGNIKGEYAKRIYFQAILRNENLARHEIPKVLQALASQITSDHEKANILKSTAEMFLNDSTLSGAFFQAVATVGSDYERRGTLSSLLKRQNLREEVLSQMLETAATIKSDYEKATFLLEASNLYAGNTRLRGAFLKTVETIKSDHERGRVLSALLRNKQLG